MLLSQKLKLLIFTSRNCSKVDQLKIENLTMLTVGTVLSTKSLSTLTGVRIFITVARAPVLTR